MRNLTKLQITAAGLCFALFLPSCRPKSDEFLKKSVVTVYSTAQLINYYEPWKPGTQSQYMERGCVLPGNRILTTAQMANKSTYLEIQKFGETKRYSAKVEQIGYDMDLAVLTVEDKDFFTGTNAVEFGEMPLQGDKIKIFGGDELSIKEDAVAGLKFLWSSEALRTVPAILINSEVAATNYGCPVFSKGKLVGVPIDTTNKPEKTGSLMPVNMIQRFLKGMKDGRKYDGFPDLGIFTQSLENATLRDFYKLKPDQTGQLISKIALNGSAVGILQENDVLLAIDGHKVDNEGFITLRKSERIEYDYLGCFYMMGEEASLDILRDGKALNIKLPMKPIGYTMPYSGDNRNPSYYMFGGFVFVPLTLNYCQMGKWEDLKATLKEYWFYGKKSAEQKQVVLLTHTLPHEINAGYAGLSDFIVKQVNGQPIGEMKDLLTAFDKPLGKFHKIQIEDHAFFGSTIIIDAKKAKKATEEIMGVFKIPSDRSDDLK